MSVQQGKNQKFLGFILLSVLGVFLCHISRADDIGHPKMDMALDLLVQAQAIVDTSDEVAQAQDTAMLTEALRLLGEEPDNDAYQGHRSQAINQVGKAINDLKANKPSKEIHKAIGRAITEIRVATGVLANPQPTVQTPVTAPPSPPPPMPPPDSPPDPGYLKNSDLADGLANWRGSGEKVFLKADGSEGAETDPGVTPVIKLALTHGQSRFVSQEIDLHNKPRKLQVQVEMCASKDFQRSKFPSDYTANESYKTMWEIGIVVPDADFWVRMGPEMQYNIWEYSTAEAQPGQWVTVKTEWSTGEKPADQFTINFCVPPGEGAVYLKNPSARP